MFQTPTLKVTRYAYKLIGVIYLWRSGALKNGEEYKKNGKKKKKEAEEKEIHQQEGRETQE